MDDHGSGGPATESAAPYRSRVAVPRLERVLLTLLLVVAATFAGLPSRAEEGDPAGPGIVRPACEDVAHITWHVASDVIPDAVGYVTAIGATIGGYFIGGGTVGPLVATTARHAGAFAESISGLAVAGSTAARLWFCWDSQDVGFFPTIGELIDKLEELTQQEIDAALRTSMAGHAYVLADLIHQLQPIVAEWETGTLSAEDRRSASVTFSTLGDKATLALRSATHHSTWLSLPMIIPLASVAITAYSLAAQLALPGGYRQRTLWQQAETRRTEMYAGLLAKEDQFRDLVRSHPVDTEADREERAALMGAVMPGYLASKAVAGYHGAFGGTARQSFFLVNNRSGSSQSCIRVGLSGENDAVGQDLYTAPCNFDTTTEEGARQVWDYVPGTAMLRHVRSGLCVSSPTETSAEDEDARHVRLATCPSADEYDAATSGESPYGWGIHPAGYLVHLATGRCLKPVVRLLTTAACAYDLPSGPGGLDAPGSVPNNVPLTDQVWHVRPATTRLRVVASGDPDVRVRSHPAGIDCGADDPVGSSCESDFEVGTSVLVAPVLDRADGWGSARWEAGCEASDATSCASLVGLNGRTVRVTLDRLRSVSVTEAAHGVVHVAPVPVLDPECADGACTHWFERETEVRLTAEPDVGFLLTGWTGACAGQGPGCSLITSQATHETAAEFAPSGVVRVTVSGSGSGSVTSPGSEIDCRAICETAAPVGSQVVLTAAPDAGHRFGGWSGPCDESGPQCVVTVGASSDVQADFVAPVAKVTPRVRVRPLSRRVRIGGMAWLDVAVRAPDIPATGRLRVRAPGVRQAARLDRRGEALVAFRVPRRARPRLVRVVVVYSGDARLTPARASTRIRVAR